MSPWLVRRLIQSGMDFLVLLSAGFLALVLSGIFLGFVARVYVGWEAQRISDNLKKK